MEVLIAINLILAQFIASIKTGVFPKNKAIYVKINHFKIFRYAYRENMTDVIIQHLITEKKGL